MASGPPANGILDVSARQDVSQRQAVFPHEVGASTDLDARARSAGQLARGRCFLSRPDSQAEWKAYHLIRQDVLLESIENEFHHPDDDEEQQPGHYPLLLWVDGRPVGTVRVDCLEDGRAALRLIAIRPDCQVRGYGLMLLREAEAFASSMGCDTAVVYSTPEAAGFYARGGYTEEAWDDTCLGGIVQMRKAI